MIEDRASLLQTARKGNTEKKMQVEDDLELLKMMMNDFKTVPPLYGVTNYWKRYEKKVVLELTRNGLKDFRRRNSILRKFGATDTLPISKARIDLSLRPFFSQNYLGRSMVNSLNDTLNTLLPVTSDAVAHKAAEDTRRLSYQHVKILGDKYAPKSIDDLIPSLVGNPADTVEINGTVYPAGFFRLYQNYVYCCRFINFTNVKLYVEIGGGSGKQIEVIKKLHPDITILAFDIPPSIYVAERYLSSVFEGQVVSYRDTKNINSAADIKLDGSIYCFGNWKFPLIDGLPVDLFWNAASFQEMEPPNVLEYLKYVNRSAAAAYLSETMFGKELATEAGQPGVFDPVTLDCYSSGLPDLPMVDMSPHWDPIGGEAFLMDTFWKRG